MVNPKAIEIMKHIDIEISHHTYGPVNMYLKDVWDYVITVCDGANEACPVLTCQVKHRLHISFEDPSKTTGAEDFKHGEYLRVSDEIREVFYKLYNEKIKAEL